MGSMQRLLAGKQPIFKEKPKPFRQLIAGLFPAPFVPPQERVSHFLRGCIASPGVSFQSLGRDPSQSPGDIAANGARKGNITSDHRLDGFVVAVSVEESPLREKLPKHDAYAKDICSVVQGFELDLLWRQVGVLSFENTGPGLAHLNLGFCQTEIEKFETAIKSKNHVLGGDVSMNHTERLAIHLCFVVRVLQCIQQVSKKGNDMVVGNVETSLQAPVTNLAQIASEHELHRQKLGILDVSDLVEFNNIRVAKTGSDLGFLKQSIQDLLFLGEIFTKGLENNGPLVSAGAVLLGEIDIRHPTDGQSFDESIAAQYVSGHQVTIS